MAIKITNKQLRQLVREEYTKALNEDDNEMSREGVEAMKDMAFEISKKLAREINSVSLSHRIDTQRLLGAIIDQVKLQMKE